MLSEAMASGHSPSKVVGEKRPYGDANDLAIGGVLTSDWFCGGLVNYDKFHVCPMSF